VPPVNVTARTEFEVEKNMLAAKNRMEMISNIIAGLAMKFDEYEEIFDRMFDILYTIPTARVVGNN
jgi:hypothetical protein